MLSKTMLSKLFDILPDADSLLRLEPEELAGHLLESLKGHEEINPGAIIKYDYLLSTLQTKIELRQKYLPEYDNKILFALMEAWQWLKNEGFVAPRPSQLSYDQFQDERIKYFITRRGQKIETTADLAVYRRAKLLPKDQLHHTIAEKVWSLFLRGDYDTAVFQGFKEVEIAVRKVGGYADTDRGVDLMRKAFHVQNGNLTDRNQQQAEKQARSDLFAGAIGSYKNPGSHRDVDVTAEEATEMIILASHLLRIVDSCK